MADNDESTAVRLFKQLDTIRAKFHKIDAARCRSNDEIKAIAGAIVYVDFNGKMKVESGLVRPDEAKRLKASSSARTVVSDADAEGEVKDTAVCRMH